MLLQEQQEHLADPTDVASRAADRFTEQAVSAARAQNKPQTHPDFDGVSCVTCGEDLHAVRLEMRRVRCTCCEDAEVKRRKLFGN